MPTPLTDELWDAISPHLPPHPPSPKGGRPRVADRAALTGILFVLRAGLRWPSLPSEMGGGSGSTCWRRFEEWTAAGVWGRAHEDLLAALGERGLAHFERAVLDSASSRAVKGGRTPARTRQTGPRAA
jgi:transposase